MHVLGGCRSPAIFDTEGTIQLAESNQSRVTEGFTRYARFVPLPSIQLKKLQTHRCFYLLIAENHVSYSYCTYYDARFPKC